MTDVVKVTQSQNVEKFATEEQNREDREDWQEVNVHAARHGCNTFQLTIIHTAFHSLIFMPS